MKRRRLTVQWFRVVWRNSRVGLGFILTMSVVVAVLSASFPWLWQFVVDEVREEGSPVKLRELALIMLSVGVAHFVCYTLLQGTRSIMNAKIERRARRHVFDHLSRVQLDVYRRWRPGDLVTRLSDDAGEKIAWFLCSGIFRAFEASLIVIACVIAMITIAPGLTFWVILPLPLLIVAQATVQGALGRRFLRVQRSISAINDELATTFAGIRIVQACRLQAPARKRFLAEADRQRGAEISTAVMQQLVFMMYGWGWQLAVVALLIAGGMSVIDGTITLGQFVTFEGLVMTIIWPMFDLGNFVSRYKQTFVALGRLQELVEEPLRVDSGGTATPDEVSISASQASIADGDDVLLEAVDLTVRKGDLVAVVGAVASGKTTLLQLLAGARALQTGTLEVGQHGLDALDYGALRRFIGYVPQDPVLLSTTIAENIALGREIDPGELDRALRLSRLEQDLPAFPDGLETAVGERGLTLSGGQQQRVALARALVGRPSVLLLDDATAALDADTEAAFWRELDDVLPEVAAVVVTHRVATIQRADRVVVLEGGRVVQEGTHSELVGLDGPYKAIYGEYEAEERLV